jgi:hypothetical protein
MALPSAWAQPFLVTSSADLRADLTVDWSDFSTVHDTLFTSDDFSSVPSSQPGQDFFLFPSSTTAAIWNQPGLNQSGVLLSSSGPGPVFLYPPTAMQGVGVTVESFDPGPRTFRVTLFRGTGEFLDESLITVPDGQVPMFIGMVDPEARIGIFAVEGLPGNRIALGQVRMQQRIVPPSDPRQLPVVTSFTLPVNATATYLHQGYGNREADAVTLAASDDNDNCHDLSDLFPSLRTGDLLLLEKLGASSLNPTTSNALLGVFSSSEELLGGTEFRRVPDALEAGASFYTPPLPNGFGVETPTNLSEDFRIGTETFAIAPAGARFLFVSAARPGKEGSESSLRIGHVPRRQFEAWKAERGLVGSLAEASSDLDGDGLTLLEEFVFQKDPTVGDSATSANFAFAPKASRSSGGQSLFQMRFGSRTDIPLRFRARVSSDLVQWQTLPESAVFRVLSDPINGRAIFGIDDPNPGPRRFGQILIDLPSP